MPQHEILKGKARGLLDDADAVVALNADVSAQKRALELAKQQQVHQAKEMLLDPIHIIQNLQNLNYGNYTYYKIKGCLLFFDCLHIFQQFTTIRKYFGIVGVSCTINWYF